VVVGGMKANKTRETVAVSLKYGVGKMKIGSIVVRCYEFEKMLAFWQQALHYVPKEPAKGGWVVLRDPEEESRTCLWTKFRKSAQAKGVDCTSTSIQTTERVR
jgi:hypothetical protein